MKIGSSSLTRADGRLNVPALRKLVDVLAEEVLAGKQIVLVTSGSIAAGFMPLGLDRRPNDIATSQAAAAVGQSSLMATYTDAFGAYDITVGQVLMTAADTVRRSRYRHAHQVFERLLELGAVPIVNENDALATSELRFGDNDRLAALVAQLVGADAMFLLTDVDGLYDAPPSQPGAKRIPVVEKMSDVAGVQVTGRGSAFGTGGMITKLQSAEMATVTGIPVVLTRAQDVAPALRGEDVGTLFVPTNGRRTRRKVWLEHAAQMTGRLVVDDGAVRALRDRGASLLAAGIRQVIGDFAAGDPVEIVSLEGELVAHGLIAYDSNELPGMLGRTTNEMVAELGEDYGRSIVHRDDLIIVRNTVTDVVTGSGLPIAD
ncbi:Glutamate 5-kinase / RNA-binding C-terminal domain PUA [Gulosibacter sp. 10]|nr:Glutamate 5-kinase / RNA-binding C-terminal domain PUA [Gulosibacter sp. 10]